MKTTNQEKLKLQNLKVQSFITKLSSDKRQTVKGGEETKTYTIDGMLCESKGINECRVTSTTNLIG